MAAVEAEGVLQVVQPLARRLVAAVDDPAIGVQQRRRAKVAVAVPPVGRTGRRAAGAHHALIEPVELGAVLGRLLPLGRRGRGLGLEPGLDRGVLGVPVREVRDQVLDHRHVRQGVDLHRALHLVHALEAGERVRAVDVHGAGAADPLAAGAAEGQRRVDLVFDLDDRIQDHRAAIVEVDEIGVHARVRPVVRVPAVDLELAQVGGAFGLRPGLALGDLRIRGKGEFRHGCLVAHTCMVRVAWVMNRRSRPRLACVETSGAALLAQAR